MFFFVVKLKTSAKKKIMEESFRESLEIFGFYLVFSKNKKKIEKKNV